jgi:nicotinamidase-related amidase
MKLPDNATLLVIDVQQAWNDTSWGERNNPDAETVIATLLAAWRKTTRPVIHIQHIDSYPDSPFVKGSRGVTFKQEALPLKNEPVIQKNVNSAFIGTDLETRLRQANVTTLVVVGFTTDHCISTTVRMAGNLGFETFVVGDALATFGKQGVDETAYPAQLIHDTALASLHTEFATVISSETLMTVLENRAALQSLWIGSSSLSESLPLRGEKGTL